MFVHFCASGQIPPPPGAGVDLWSGTIEKRRTGLPFKNGIFRILDPDAIRGIIYNNSGLGGYRNLTEIINGINSGYITNLTLVDFETLIDVAKNSPTELDQICSIAYNRGFSGFEACDSYVPIPKYLHYLLLLTFLGMTLLRKYSKKYIEIKFLFYDKIRRTP